MNSIGDLTKLSVPGASLCTVAAFAGAGTGIVVVLGLVALLLSYAWKVYEQPELFGRWLDLRDRRKGN